MKKILPPIDGLQDAATEILAERDPVAIESGLRAFLQYYDPINYNLWYGAPLWRARKCSNAVGFDRLSDVHCPPAAKATTGRLNNQGAPMLYLSFNKFTTFQEVGAAAGDYLHLVGYTMGSARIRSLIIGEINNVHKSGCATLPRLGDQLNRILNEMSPAAGVSFVFMDAFLAAILADKEAEPKKYVHSRVLAHLLFERYPSVRAIHYPSVALEGSMNLAVKPEAAAACLRVCGTSVIQIKNRYNYGIYDFEVARKARSIAEDDRIDWYEHF